MLINVFEKHSGKKLEKEKYTCQWKPTGK